MRQRPQSQLLRLCQALAVIPSKYQLYRPGVVSLRDTLETSVLCTTAKKVDVVAWPEKLGGVYVNKLL